MASLSTMKSFCAGLFGSALLLGLPATAGTLSTLYTFTGGADGALPMSSPRVASSGVVFGDTFLGGETCSSEGPQGCGVTYRFEEGVGLTPLVTFKGGTDGFVPETSLVLIANTLFGSTRVGGENNVGFLYSVGVAGSKYKILHSFSGPDGANPWLNLISDPDGNIFGIAQNGGAVDFGVGVLFELSAAGTYSVLHSFPEGGEVEPSSIVLDSAGTLFGTTLSEGFCKPRGHASGNAVFCGTVFSYVPSTGVFTTIHSFKGRYDGAYPLLGGVNGNGTLFGATTAGGEFNAGGLFELRRDATGYTYRNIHSFTGGADGGTPNQPYVDQHGNITGTTQTGGLVGGQKAAGTLYSLPRAGTLTTLYTFSTTTAGLNPQAQVTYANGAFYGVTLGNGTQPCVTPGGSQINSDGCGTIWKYTP